MSEITYHLFGDSHAGKHINHPNIKRYPMIAASAMGLNNPKSFSGYQKEFLDIYNKISKNDKIMLKYGQVDTEYVYYMKYSNKPLPFIDFARDSVNKYFSFILNNLDTKNVIILSIYPTLIEDKYLPEQITKVHTLFNRFKEVKEKLRKVKIPNINRRVIFNKVYNKLLKQKCDELNIPFIDLESVLLRKRKRIIEDETGKRVVFIDKSIYKNTIPDHHLKNKEGIKKVNDVINQFITNNTN